MYNFNAVAVLMKVLNTAVTEKVIRIILAVFRNMIEKPVNENIVNKYCTFMIQLNLLEKLQKLKRANHVDKDIASDIEFFTERLKNFAENINTFDRYLAEIRSGHLEWSPVHRTVDFWIANAHRLNENDHEVICALIQLLKTSTNTLVLAVAIYDIGEYLRYAYQGQR